jgi:hypothetical protein
VRISCAALLALALTFAVAAPNYAPPPGALNPQVMQANISTTICALGWTGTVRPPVQYTNALKRRQMAERHLPGKPDDYEENHLIPLELGGHPTDLKNLWPQPLAQARRKGRLELALNRAVCAGRMTLGVAQQTIKDPAAWSD